MAEKKIEVLSGVYCAALGLLLVVVYVTCCSTGREMSPADAEKGADIWRSLHDLKKTTTVLCDYDHAKVINCEVVSAEKGFVILLQCEGGICRVDRSCNK